MRYMMHLMAHNGVAGANPVEPFGGYVDQCSEIKDGYHADIETDHDGRVFGYSHTERDADETRYYFRERRFGEPSDWAKEQAAK